MPENTSGATFVESTINSVTFTPTDTHLADRTYIEIEPGYWRPLHGPVEVLSSHVEFEAAINEYFASRFAGEDLPAYPGSGNAPGDGNGGGDGTGGGDGGWGGGSGSDGSDHGATA